MGFLCHAGLFWFKCMHFYLTNAPVTFQRALKVILSGFKRKRLTGVPRWRHCFLWFSERTSPSRWRSLTHLANRACLFKIVETWAFSYNSHICWLRGQRCTTEYSILCHQVTKGSFASTRRSRIKIFFRVAQRLSSLRSQLCTYCGST